jgi:hypothetical protein
MLHLTAISLALHSDIGYLQLFATEPQLPIAALYPQKIGILKNTDTVNISQGKHLLNYLQKSHE